MRLPAASRPRARRRVSAQLPAHTHAHSARRGHTASPAARRRLSAARAAPQVLPQVYKPQSIVDISNGNILGYAEQLAEGHPGYHDAAYKRRRAALSQAAQAHQIGDPIPDVEYTADEVATWDLALRKLRTLIPKHACAEFIDAFERMDFQEGRVPQLQAVHERLQAATGWAVRPVAGLMHPRDFLNGLAFKTFHSTQYVRHHSQPTYTPEPDVIHEILGHVPMLMNGDFCRMAEALGRASLGASDATIWHLTKVYWYTVEFGVVREARAVKAFGAGILSSYGELEWMGAGKAAVAPLDPWRPLPKMSYKDGYQRQYFCLDGFEEGAALLQRVAATIEAHHGVWVPAPLPSQ